MLDDVILDLQATNKDQIGQMALVVGNPGWLSRLVRVGLTWEAQVLRRKQRPGVTLG